MLNPSTNRISIYLVTEVSEDPPPPLTETPEQLSMFLVQDFNCNYEIGQGGLPKVELPGHVTNEIG